MIPYPVSDNITLAATGVQTIPKPGAYLLFLTASGSFKFSVDGGPEQLGVTGLGMSMPEGFNKITVIDTSGNSNTIAYVIAQAAVAYSISFQKNAPTYTKATFSTIADGGTATFTGVDTKGQIRKTFIITNQGNTQLYVCDSGSNVGITLPVDSVNFFPRVVETSGAINVVNQSGSGAGEYSILEIFYS